VSNAEKNIILITHKVQENFTRRNLCDTVGCGSQRLPLHAKGSRYTEVLAATSIKLMGGCFSWGRNTATPLVVTKATTMQPI